MTKNEKKYIYNTFRDKKDEIQRALDHYNEIDKIGEEENIKFCLAQMKLINELYNDFFKGMIEPIEED